MKKLLMLIVASMMMVTYSCKEETTDPSVDKKSKHDHSKGSGKSDKASDEASNEDNVVQFTKVDDDTPLFHFGGQTTEDITYTYKLKPNTKTIKSFTVTGVKDKIGVSTTKESDTEVKIDATTVTKLEVEVGKEDSDDHIASSKQLKFKIKVAKEATTESKEMVDYTIVTTFEDKTTETFNLKFEAIKAPNIKFAGGTSSEQGFEDSLGLVASGGSLDTSDAIGGSGGTACQTIITIDETKFFAETGATGGSNAIAAFTLDKIIIKSETVTKVKVTSQTNAGSNGLAVSSTGDMLTAIIHSDAITDYTDTTGKFLFKLIDASASGVSKVTPIIYLTYTDSDTSKVLKLIVKGSVTKVKSGTG